MGWNQVNVDGTIVHHYRQEFANECGPSSVVMVARIWDKGLSIDSARGKISSVDARHNASFQPNWTQDWSYISSLAHALSGQGIINSHTRKLLNPARYKKLLWEETTAKKPAIVRIQWGGFVDGNFLYQGGHFVVCLGPNAAGDRLNILDPAAEGGLVTVPNWNMFPGYDPPYGGNGHLDKNYSISTC